MGTDFNTIYTRFYSKVTDDMYMELDQLQTDALLEELLINALPWFEFPKISLEYSISSHSFDNTLSNEEINIIATYMLLGWFDQQLASVEVTRMKYSGSDFKMTSQANHMSKLKELRKEYERIGFHLQRLYKRRKRTSSGQIVSTFGSIMASSVRGGIVSTSQSTDSGNSKPGEEWEDLEEDFTEEIPNQGGSSGSGDWEDMEDFPPDLGGNDGWDSV